MRKKLLTALLFGVLLLLLACPAALGDAGAGTVGGITDETSCTSITIHFTLFVKDDAGFLGRACYAKLSAGNVSQTATFYYPMVIYTSEDHSYTFSGLQPNTIYTISVASLMPSITTKSHSYTNYVSNGDGTHKVLCSSGCNGVKEGYSAVPCSGGTATCMQKAVCRFCGEEYGAIAPNNHDIEHHDAKAPTCTAIGWNAYDVCTREGCNYSTYKELPALDHDIAQHDAKAPTCTAIGWDAYIDCKRTGCDYSTYKEIPALEHDIVHHNAKRATCTAFGWTAYDTCSREGCDYTTYAEIPPMSHWYGAWTGNGDGTHTAECQRYGCTHTYISSCELYEYETIAVCPVCGEGHGAEFIPLTNFVVTPKVKGDVYVYGAEAPLENVLYAFSVVNESNGKTGDFIATLRLTFPCVLPDSFTLVRADAPNEPIDYTVKNNTIFVKVKSGGLFLLLP